MKRFCVLNLDVFATRLALALFNDHDASLAHFSPAAQGNDHIARFCRGAARAVRVSLCARLPVGWNEHGRALTKAHVIVNGQGLTAVLCYAL